MASKKALLGGAQVKVENLSGYDKSRFNAFTAPLGAIVPMCKQLILPGKGHLSVKISAQLPPLATDAFLRSHLKVEAFLCPMRLLYGGFESWFASERIISPNYPRGIAKLPRLKVVGTVVDGDGTHAMSQGRLNGLFGPHSLMDYFDVKLAIDGVGGSGGRVAGDVIAPAWAMNTTNRNYSYFNIFPFLAYQLIYHHFYRNKLIETELFGKPNFSDSAISVGDRCTYLPFQAFSSIKDIEYNLANDFQSNNSIALNNGSIVTLRYRNYGFDYFTTALPSAQEGSPLSVDTTGNTFTISSLRLANALQHFAEVNQLCGPDFIQVCRSRYGTAPSGSVAQRPILLGSADFPMFTSGVEQTAQDAGSSPNGNPFAGIAARYGRAHAEGSDFVCDFNCDEPSYLMVMCSLVPEANYARGVAHDMKVFTEEGSLMDLPNHMLELSGYDPIYSSEVWKDDSGSNNPLVFGYQPRFMWHKAGAVNQVHGLFRKGASLESFIPQRDFPDTLSSVTLGTNFLKVQNTDLDNVTAVGGALSSYGVMVDSAIDLYVSEPLGESALPSLADPAYEHGRSVYLKRGGITVNE